MPGVVADSSAMDVTKSKKKKTAVVEAESEEEVVVKVKKSKRSEESGESKRKRSSEAAAEEEEEPAVEAKPKKSKKSKATEEEKEEKPAAEEDGVDPKLALSNFRISALSVSALKARGVKALFPIQAQTFNPIFEGKDVVGQARTGSGKTLSFSLPIMERMFENPRKSRGRGPMFLILAPTRELAKQIEKEIETLCSGRPITLACFYGGTSYDSQNSAMYNGIDVVRFDFLLLLLADPACFPACRHARPHH